MNRHIGRFDIPTEVIHKRLECVKKIMGECVIIRAEYMYDRDAIAYLAISDHFREVPLESTAPRYKILIEDNLIKFIEDTGEK